MGSSVGCVFPTSGVANHTWSTSGRTHCIDKGFGYNTVAGKRRKNQNTTGTTAGPCAGVMQIWMEHQHPRQIQTKKCKYTCWSKTGLNRTTVSTQPAQGPQLHYLANNSTSLAGTQSIPLTRWLDRNSASDVPRVPADNLTPANRSCVIWDTGFDLEKL